MEKHILLSIQPRIVDELISGTKKFEFRKKFPDPNNIQISRKVIIYCSSPVMKIVGSFSIGEHYHSDFELLMQQVSATDDYKRRISRYFKEKKSCYALEITQLKIYEFPLSLGYLRTVVPGFVPGQSYRYLDEKIIESIVEQNGYI